MKRRHGFGDIVKFDVDEAHYLGGRPREARRGSDTSDGVYYQTGKGKGGWYVTTVVDSDSAHFVDTLSKDDGPYDSEDAARCAGASAAANWAMNNGVRITEKDRRRAFKGCFKARKSGGFKGGCGCGE